MQDLLHHRNISAHTKGERLLETRSEEAAVEGEIEIWSEAVVHKTLLSAKTIRKRQG